MDLKTVIRANKKGSYILEAAMALPVFIICFVSIALVILIISRCENIVFVASEKSCKLDETAPLILTNIRDESYDLKHFRYMFSEKEIDDLILMDTQTKMDVTDPIGIDGRIVFRMKVLSRARTGKTETTGSLPEEEFMGSGRSVEVVIFPKYGYRYHVKNCRYVVQEYEGEEVKLVMQLKDAELKGYSPCLVCGGGDG